MNGYPLQEDIPPGKKMEQKDIETTPQIEEAYGIAKNNLLITHTMS